MIIALDVSPIDSDSKSQHKVRGVGVYIKLLSDNLEKFDSKNEYIFTSKPTNIREADIIHYPYMDPFFVTFPLIKKKKTVITVHDLIPIQYKSHFPAGIKGNLAWQFNKKVLKSSDRIITDSEASKKAVNKLVGINEQKIIAVYLGVEKKFGKKEIQKKVWEEIVEKYNIPQQYFLYVGDVTWNKNLPRLVEAIKNVNIPLVMVGRALVSDFDKKNPWNKDREIVANLTDTSLFIKTGFVEDETLVALYNNALALCMPSLDEGFGLPVLEGMSCGTPIITSKEGSLPEVAGDAALYVNAESTDDISEKLLILNSDKNLQTQLSVKSIKQAEKFSIKKMMDDTIDVYNSLSS